MGDLHTAHLEFGFLDAFFLINPSSKHPFVNLNTKLSFRFISRGNGILLIGCAAPKG